MKKLFLLAVTIFSFSSIYAANNEQQTFNEAVSPKTMYYADSDTIKVLVEISDTVDELCSYFDNSWADIGLSIYCKTPGAAATPITCTTFMVVDAICVANGIIQLSIEGDWEGVAKEVVKEMGAEIVYRLIGTSAGYKLEPARTR